MAKVTEGGRSSEPIAVLLGADGLLPPRTGIGRLTLEIARQLTGHEAIADFALLAGGKVHPKEWIGDLLADADAWAPDRSAVRPARLPAARHLAARVAPLRRLRNLWRRVPLDRAVRRLGGGSPVVYHEPNLISAPYDGPTVVTVNDLAWRYDPSLLPLERLRWIERNLPRVLAGATRLVAVSAFTAAEMQRELGLSPSRIAVVPEAAAAIFRPIGAAEAAPALRRHGLSDRGYVFSVATLEPRKNLDRLLAAHQALPAAWRARVPLAIAGGAGWGEVLRGSEGAVASGALRLLGHVPDRELAALVARSAAFAFVSLYEGFALPVVEAMAAGAAVLASVTTATGETAGDGALLVDPRDTGAIADGLLTLLEDSEAAERWRRAGLRRAAQFSWAKTVDQLVDVWRAAVAG